MDKAAKEGLEALIDPLRLSVHLRVARRAHPQLGMSEAEHLLPQGAREFGILVEDYGLGQSI